MLDWSEAQIVFFFFFFFFCFFFFFFVCFCFCLFFFFFSCEGSITLRRASEIAFLPQTPAFTNNFFEIFRNNDNMYEPLYEKTNNLHRRKQSRRSTAQLISAFVFATRVVQSLFYLITKFQASSHLLCLYSPVCVRPVRKPHCWFSHEAAHM